MEKVFPGDSKKVVQMGSMSKTWPSIGRFMSRFNGINVYVFFLLITVYQVLITMQGVDFLDEGFHVSLYQQVLSNPESVQYGFVYWLTIITGGIIMKLTGALGLWGIRLAGVAVTTLTAALSYIMLGKFVPRKYLQAGIFAIVIFLITDPKNFYYNNYSSFLYLLTAFCLFRGLSRGKNGYLFFAGFITGANIFTRIPNVLGVGICLAIVYYSYLEKDSITGSLKKIAIFLAGTLSSVIVVFGVMKIMGHLDLFTGSVRMLFPDPKLKKDLILDEGGYEADSMILTLVKQYFDVFNSVLVFLSLLLVLSVAKYNFEKGSRITRRFGNILISVVAAYVIYRFVRSSIYDYMMLKLLVGFSILGVLYIMTNRYGSELKLISFIGLYILLVHPVGSYLGIYFVAPYSLWMIFPLSFYVLCSIENMDLSAKFSLFKRRQSVELLLNSARGRNVKLMLAGVFFLACLYRILVFPYVEDWHSRTSMRYSVSSEKMHHIYTSGDRARVISELLDESNKYIKKNDYVLAYEMIPMYHYLTETRSFVRNPCPWYYSSGLFASQLQLADSLHTPPYVVMQKVLTMGDGNGWPEKIYYEDYTNWKRNANRFKVFQDYLNKHGYVTVWENEIFRILKPTR